MESEKLIILKRVLIKQSFFEGKEIHELGVAVSFKCCSCGSNIEVTINGDNVKLIDDLVDQGQLTKLEILKNGLAKENSKLNKHLGEFILAPNVFVQYRLQNCTECMTNYIAVFCFGETQPGRNICQLSGIWQVNKSS